MLRHRALTLFMSLALIFILAGIASAQEAAPFAGVRAGQLVISDGTAGFTTIQNPANYGFQSLAWSPDGSTLAYILSDQDFQSRLYALNPEDGQPVLLETGRLEAGFPVSFDPDGRILYAASTYDPANFSPTYTVAINRIAPAAGAQPETLATVPFTVGCGGGSPIPADWQYWGESGFGGGYLILQWTELGILHSLNCGGQGQGLVDPQTGQERSLTAAPVDSQNVPDSAGGNPALSPDGRTLAVVKTVYAEPTPIRSLVLIDMASGAITDVATQVAPQQLAWGPDGVLFYSSVQFARDLMAELTPAQRAVIEQTQGTGMMVGANRVAIHRLDIAAGVESVLYNSDAYQIGRMRLADDGSLWFSQIANLEGWLAALASGQLNPLQDDTTGTQQRALVPVSVYRLDLASGEAALVADDLSQFTLRPAVG